MYYSGSRSTAPAVARDIIEAELMEQYHWLPTDIAKIPYRKLQKLFIIKKQKSESAQHQANIVKFKQQHSQQTRGRGQFKREV